MSTKMKYLNNTGCRLKKARRGMEVAKDIIAGIEKNKANMATAVFGGVFSGVLLLLPPTALGQSYSYYDDTAIVKQKEEINNAAKEEELKTYPAVESPKLLQYEMDLKPPAKDIYSPEYLERYKNDPAALEEIQHMRKLNRERDINDAIMQIGAIDKELTETTATLNGLKNAQMRGEVKASMQIKMLAKQEELLKRKAVLTEKIELMQSQKQDR